MTTPLLPPDALDLAEIDPDDWKALGDRMDGHYPVPILVEPKGGPIPEAQP